MEMTAAKAQALAAFLGGEEAGHSHAFREIVEILPVAVYVTDAIGRLTYFNDAARELSNEGPALDTDQWFTAWKISLADGKPLAADQCPMALALKGAPVLNGIECFAERRDGTRFWFMPYSHVLRDSQGCVRGVVNVLADITERKNAEIEAREQFRAIVETTPECVKIVAHDGTLLFMNPPGVGMVGASSAGSILGKSVYDLIAPEDRERFREFNARICGGEKGSLEFDIVSLQGIRRNMESHAAPLQYVDGSTVQLAVTHDVTSRKTALDALHASEERFRLAQHAARIGVFEWNIQTGALTWSRELEELHGLEPGGFERTPSAWADLVHPEDRAGAIAQMDQAATTGEPVVAEWRVIWPDGSVHWLAGRFQAYRDAEGLPARMTGVNFDITERKQMESQLRRANVDLEQFAYSAAHDLQEPLRSLMIYSELLTQRYGKSFDEDARQCVQFVHSGAQRMRTLLRDLLSYTQLMKFDPPAEPCDANQALRTALANLSGAIAESGAQIEAKPLPTVTVHPAHLQQLFQNLIGNAIKYRSNDKEPRVAIEAQRDKGNWMFSVADNGIGIEPQYQERIFLVSTRLHTDEKYPGSGIGLAICHRIVEKYRGSIWVDSEPGKGSTFRFTLPA